MDWILKLHLKMMLIKATLLNSIYHPLHLHKTNIQPRSKSQISLQDLIVMVLEALDVKKQSQNFTGEYYKTKKRFTNISSREVGHLMDPQ